MELEAWKDIPSCKNHYQASSFGRIRSIKTTKKILSLDYSCKYPRVDISINGKRQKKRVHGLVTEAFYGKRPEGQEVRHLDDIPLNNHIRNLAYGTHKENGADLKRNGKSSKANRTTTKLTIRNVRHIKYLLSRKNRTQTTIALMFNVSQQLICDINKQRAWAYV